ncbi:MAG TPA: 4-hydroxy-tetrahydrodipicolinate synthase [Trebonia sp.]|jgi:4-hydroxy-tetrahydrodipicolinate synthase
MSTTRAPFGRTMTAMITPMARDGAIDYDGAARVATYLVDDMRNEGLVVNGTTGEAPTTTDEEKERLLKTVIEAVGDRAKIVAGVGTNITAHTIHLARQAQDAGADGLLVVTPYYNKPAQDALAAHFLAVADSTDLPIVIYDIPGRTGSAVATDTLVKLAAHPNIVGVKDAKDDLNATSHVLTRTDLVYYSGTDLLNLPLLSIGAVGFVSVVGHVVGDRLLELVRAHEAGRNADAIRIHRELLPVYDGIFRNQGVVMAKAALDLLGLPGGTVRQPLLPASDAERQRLREDLTAGQVKLPGLHHSRPGNDLYGGLGVPPGDTGRTLALGQHDAGTSTGTRDSACPRAAHRPRSSD